MPPQMIKCNLLLMILRAMTEQIHAGTSTTAWSPHHMRTCSPTISRIHHPEREGMAPYKPYRNLRLRSRALQIDIGIPTTVMHETDSSALSHNSTTVAGAPKLDTALQQSERPAGGKVGR